jgi:hypothetical protein
LTNNVCAVLKVDAELAACTNANVEVVCPVNAPFALMAVPPAAAAVNTPRETPATVPPVEFVVTSCVGT